MNDAELDWGRILEDLCSLEETWTTPVLVRMKFTVYVEDPTTYPLLSMTFPAKNIPYFLCKFDQVRCLDRDSVDGFAEVWFFLDWREIFLLILKKIADDLPC